VSLRKAFDVAIIGGGVIGLALARAAAGRDMSVVVLERNECVGQEASRAAAGMLAPQAEANSADDFFRLGAASRDLYPRFAAELFEETGVDVELDRNGTLYLALNEHDAAEIERRFAWQRRAGLSIERLTGAQARELEPNLSDAVQLALFFPDDWQVEPRRLCAALERACIKRGVKIKTGAEVLSLRVEARRITGVETVRGFVAANSCVVAGGAWSSSIKIPNFEMPPVTPVRGQMLCFDAKGLDEPNRKFARHILYSPRGYIVPRGDGRLLAGSTCEFVGFNKDVTDAGREAIRRHAREIAPAIENLNLIDAWANLRPRAEDGLPLIGRAPQSCGFENLYFAAGHFRNGILLAPITAATLANLIADDQTDRLMAPFAPERLARVSGSNAS
jgi:glycine oxidase